MNKTSEIEKELEELRRLKRKFLGVRKDKLEASDLESSISGFVHTLSVRFPLASNFYIKNHFVEIRFTDGCNDLRTYSESKLKVKDDSYFVKGKEHIRMGMDGLIRSLENLLEK